jgi:hypothetical protein
VVRETWRILPSTRLNRCAASAAKAVLQVEAIELRDHPELPQQFRIVDRLGPGPIQPIVVRADLNPK